VEGSIAQLESLEIAYIGATLRGPPRAFVERPVPSGTACHCQPASRLCIFTRSYIFHQLSHGVSLDPSQVCLGFRYMRLPANTCSSVSAMQDIPLTPLQESEDGSA